LGSGPRAFQIHVGFGNRHYMLHVLCNRAALWICMTNLSPVAVLAHELDWVRRWRLKDWQLAFWTIVSSAGYSGLAAAQRELLAPGYQAWHCYPDVSWEYLLDTERNCLLRFEVRGELVDGPVACHCVSVRECQCINRRCKNKVFTYIRASSTFQTLCYDMSARTT
jgi:hypothetical protein